MRARSATGSGPAARAYGSGTKRERSPAGRHDTRRPPATRGPPGRDRRRDGHRRVDPAPVGRLGATVIEPRGRRGVPAGRWPTSPRRRPRRRHRPSRRTRSPARAADWELVSLDHLGTWTVRSWIPANAVRAEGPLDPSIRPVTMESPEVLAIGACSPATSDDAGRDLPGGPAHLVRAWRIEAGRATPVSLSVHRDEPLPGVATLYNLTDARPRPATDVAAWPAGEFVVEVAPVGLPDGRAAGSARSGPRPRHGGSPRGGSSGSSSADPGKAGAAAGLSGGAAPARCRTPRGP